MTVVIISNDGNGKTRCLNCGEVYDRIVKSCTNQWCIKWKEQE